MALLHNYSDTKSGKDLCLPGSFRPISLTSCVCKLLERIVSERLIWVLEDLQCLSPLQFGFQRFCSTADPLLRLEYDISEAFHEKKFVLSVLFDVQKAYDTTWRREVLRKLASLGIHGHLPSFIENLLTERVFRVRVGDTLSPPFNQGRGCAPGERS